MCLFKQWSFLFDNRAKVFFFECISHCLGCDRRWKDVVDKMCGLDSIIQSSSSNLLNNRLFIPRGKLGRATTFAVFLVQIKLLADSSNGRPSQTSFGLNLPKRISFFEKRSDRRTLSSRCRLHVVVERKKDGWTWFQQSKQMIIISHDFVYFLTTFYQQFSLLFMINC